MVGAEPPPNRSGGIEGAMTEVTNVRSTIAVTMTALGAATPAGCARAAATTDREVVCMVGKLAFC
jgi:thiamine pyrophosphate-dependent acetolactate synthase large subunit-like protein